MMAMSTRSPNRERPCRVSTTIRTSSDVLEPRASTVGAVTLYIRKGQQSLSIAWTATVHRLTYHRTRKKRGIPQTCKNSAKRGMEKDGKQGGPTIRPRLSSCWSVILYARTLGGSLNHPSKRKKKAMCMPEPLIGSSAEF